VERSDALDERISLSSDVDALTRYGHRNRTLIKWVAASLALDMVLSVALGYVAIRAQQVANQADSIAQSQYNSCLAGNEYRKGQLQLWHYVLDLNSTSSNMTELQKQQAGQFRRYVDQQFALRPCQRSSS
jgi:hypothetical protein